MAQFTKNQFLRTSWEVITEQITVVIDTHIKSTRITSGCKCKLQIN